VACVNSLHSSTLEIADFHCPRYVPSCCSSSLLVKQPLKTRNRALLSTQTSCLFGKPADADHLTWH
ncbi:FNIP repeat-containing protein, partial [Clarias magur]